MGKAVDFEGARRTLAQMPYRGTSPMTNRPPLGTYRRHMPRVLEVSWGVGIFL